MNRTNSNNLPPDKRRSLFSKLRYRVCDFCGYDANEPSSIICENCQQSLIPKPKQKVGNSLDRDKQPNTQNTSQKQVAKSNNVRNYVFVVLGGIVAIVPGVIAFMLHSSPVAAIRNTKGTISFGGEPCSQRLVNQKIANAVSNINSELKFRYLDNDPHKDQIRELIEGQVQLAFSENAYLDSHLKRAKERGVEIEAIPYAYDGIAYVTDRKTEARPLTIGELEAIFQGKITNWKQLGGEDKKIIPILVSGLWQNPMGIRLVEQLNPNTVFISDRIEAKEFLKKTDGAIFYTSATLAAGELNNLNVVSIKNDDGTVVSPVLLAGVTNQQAINSGEYPLVRTVNVIVNGEVFQDRQNDLALQKQGIRGFVKYLVSPPGQAIVEDAGFVPMYEVARENESPFSFLPW